MEMNRGRAVLGVVLGLMLASSAHGETPGASRFVVSHWGVSDGLPQTSVTAIAQDDRGFIWVATFGGLARFDGRNFVRVDPAHGDLDGHRFLSVACTGSTIWVGTDHGRLFRFDDYGEREPVEVKLQSASIEPIWQLLVDGERMLIAAGVGGVHSLQLSSGKLERLDRKPRIALALGLDSLHRIWVAGDERVGRLDTDETYEVHEPVALWPTGTSMGVVAREGRFVVRDGALQKVGTGGRTFEDARHAQTWISTSEGLVLTTVLGENKIPLPSTRDSAPSVRALLLDASDCLWVATDENGLYRVRDRHLITVAEKAGLEGGSALLVHALGDGSALISTYCHGLQRLDTGLPRRVTRVPGPADDDCIFAMAQGDGGVWVALSNLIGWFDGERVVKVPSDLDPKLPGDLRALATRGKVVWAGSSDGLTKLEGDRTGLRVVRRWTAAHGLPHDSVFSLAFDGDDLLVGTVRGLVRIGPDDKPRSVIRSDDQRPAVVRDLLVEPDGIWAATYGEGLAHIDRQGHATWLVREHGFCSDELSRLVQVGNDVWLNGNQGAFKLSLAELRAAAKSDDANVTCRFFDSVEGNGGGQPAGTQLGSFLAFPTVEGVVLIDPEDFREAPPPPALFLRSATVDETALSQRATVAVPPGRRDFAVQLMMPPGGDDLREPTDVSTLLVRDGVETLQRTGGLSATYIGLPPGEYLFRAQRDGGKPVEFAFSLQRSFTETRLARIGIPFLILALIGLVLRSYLENVRSRTRALEAQLDERMQAERARKERDELYATVFDVSPGPLFVFLTDGTLREANPAARKWLGSGTLTFPLKGLPFIDEPERPAFLQLLTAAAQQPTHAETTLNSAARGKRRLAIDAGPLHFGGEGQVLVAATDVTSSREAEQQRAELLERNANAQRLEGLGRLAAGVAHDFNNVLAALQLQLEDLKLSRSDPKSVQTLTGEMEEAVRTGRDLTSRFLVFGKGDTQPSVFELDAALEESKRLLTRLMKGDVEFEVLRGAASARVKMPRVHLDRVLLNLVLNARDALNPTGTRRVSVRTTQVDACPALAADEVQVLPAPEGKCVVLEVADTGCGMSSETLKRAFEPFFTTRASTQGTGLGLTVVHNIALRLGAGLTAWSQPSVGTRFRLQLPMITSPSQELPRVPATLTAGFRVLVADDTALLRKSLVRQFKSDGWDVLEAADGKQALDQCTAQTFDLLITDLVMPELDGVELILRLRERGSQMPIILLSGYTGDATARLDLAKARVEAMDKPFVPDELLALARRLVGAARPTS
ncbi:MAG: response regulator [Archangium sp.]